MVITSTLNTYGVLLTNGKTEKISSPYFFTDDGNIKTVVEPWVNMKIISPSTYLGNIMQLLFDHEAEIGEVPGSDPRVVRHENIAVL